MRGQVIFFNAERNFGFVSDEKGEKYYFQGSEWLGENVHRNEWVEFQSAPNSNPEGTPYMAVGIQPIECPPEYLLHGTVYSFFPDRLYGFISHKEYGAERRTFFHSSDVFLIDGKEVEPRAGCKVSFCLGQKTNKPLAVQVAILEWPDADSISDVEEYFKSAPELPLDVPEPVAPSPKLIPAQSVLDGSTRTLTLREICLQRRLKDLYEPKSR
jgi:cold shock CspA family protein